MLDEALERAPADFYVRLKRGELFCRLGIYETAVDALEQAMRSPTDDRVGRQAALRWLRRWFSRWCLGRVLPRRRQRSHSRIPAAFNSAVDPIWPVLRQAH